MKESKTLLFLVCLFCWLKPCLLADPCENFISFTEEKRRLITNKFQTGGLYEPLSDAYIPTDGYYGSPGYRLAKNATSDQICGTLYPIWVKDYPVNRVPGEKHVDRIACVVSQDNTCIRSLVIRIHFCKGFDIYKLKRTQTHSAYCLEPTHHEESIKTPTFVATPRVEIRLDNSRSSGHTEFLCKFDASQTENELFYQIIWYYNKLQLHTFPSRKWSSDILDETKLTEEILKNNGYLHAGFNVQCGVRARYDRSFPSGQTGKSAELFIGINIEPSEVAIYDNGKASVHLNTSIPFGCGTSLERCEIDVVVFHDQDNQCSRKALVESACGVIMNHTSSQPLNIDGDMAQHLGTEPVETRVNLQTKDMMALPFWSNYDIGNVKVMLIRTKNRVADGQECRATGDPHLVTFDGGKFDIHLENTFHLYKHTTFPIQVQMKTRFVHGRHIGYACGLAIGVGRSVYVVDVCTPDNIQTNFVQCEDGTDMINVKTSGKSYKFILPTGTEVRVDVNSNFINIHMFSGPGDPEKTMGLCGNLNGNCEDDFQTRSGKTVTFQETCRSGSHHGADEFSKSWIVGTDENLFTFSGRRNLIPWSNRFRYCYCNKPFTASHQSLWNTGVECSANTKSCSIIPNFNNRHPICNKAANRRRRSLSIKADDIHKNTSIEKRSTDDLPVGWTKEKATERCQAAYNRSAAVKACTGIISPSRISDRLSECIEDLTMTGDEELLKSGLESLKASCLHQIEISPDMHQKGQNNTKSILETVLDVTCPSDCNNKGTCKKGVCICKLPYGGPDCSVNQDLPPVINKLQNDGHCDLREEKCTQVIVKGKDFIESDDLKCRMTSFTIDSEGNMKNGIVSYTKAIVQNFAEIACPIPVSRKTRSASVTIHVAHGFRVAVSNNAIVYGNENIMVIFNSGCQQCEINGATVTCVHTTDSCILHGQCLTPGKLYPEDKCLQCVSSQWKRSSGCGHGEDNKLLWIIGVVLGTAALVVISIAGILYYMKRKHRRNVTPRPQPPPPYTAQSEKMWATKR